MAIVDETSLIWGEIDRAENYLVCCMFTEAVSLASTILKQLLESHNRSSGVSASESRESEWCDMLESAGMVFVQSMKQFQRTKELMKELKLLFGSLTLIPIHVFVTGVCFQLSEGLSTIAQGFLEEFVDSWMYADDQYHPLSGADTRLTDTGGSCFPFSISVDEYLEVVELYVVTLLARTLNEIDLAVSWVEKASLPTEKRQVLLRQLQSMRSSSMASASQTSISPQLSDAYKSEFLRTQTPNGGHQKDMVPENLSHEQHHTAMAEIVKLSRKRVPYYSWFPAINVKLGKMQFAIPSGKLLLASLILIICYLTRKKQALLKRFLAKRAFSLRKALLDLWQLAFSYQVNPLAAVQTLPNSTRGNR